jgi:hypothetical protein
VVGSYHFLDTVSTTYAALGYTNYCGPIDWTFTIGGLITVELAGTNTKGTIIFAPPISINPGNRRNANLRATLKYYPSIFVDNPFQVTAYTATLALPPSQNYTVGEKAKSFLIDTNTIFMPQSPPLPFKTNWQICLQNYPLVNLLYPLDPK